VAPRRNRILSLRIVQERRVELVVEGSRPSRHGAAQREVVEAIDNSSTHKTPSIQRWLVRQPSPCNFTPTYGSWLNLVKRWFAELTTKSIKRSAHRSVRDLVASIRTWVNNWNEDPKPYVWYKTADEILDSLANYCQRISIQVAVRDSNDFTAPWHQRDRRSEGPGVTLRTRSVLL